MSFFQSGETKLRQRSQGIKRYTNKNNLKEIKMTTSKKNFEKEYPRVHSMLEELKKENEELKAENEKEKKRKQNIARLFMNIIRRKEKENDASKEIIDSLENAIEMKDKEIAQLKDRSFGLAIENEKLKKENDQLEEHTKNLRIDRKASKIEIQELKKKNEMHRNNSRLRVQYNQKLQKENEELKKVMGSSSLAMTDKEFEKVFGFGREIFVESSIKMSWVDAETGTKIELDEHYLECDDYSCSCGKYK
jgi:small-conductance mechanosensitive channel